MSTKQKFGGPWTVDKLNILSDYLDFYTTALKNQPFDLIYIDAFAGTGKILIGEEEQYEEIDGSVRLALQSKGRFAEYIFIEKKPSFVKELKSMVEQDFPEKKNKVKIEKGDCNSVLLEICQKVNWNKTRAVLFIDPYAANVEWETLQTIAATGAIDVWYLFPFHAANRMLRRDGQIDPAWEAKLNSIFGDNSWRDQIYHDDPQTNLFGIDEVYKESSTDKLKRYIEGRLSTVFKGVSSNSRILYNRKNSPLFLFCFAVSNDNPKAKALAMKVANYILKDQNPS